MLRRFASLLVVLAVAACARPFASVEPTLSAPKPARKTWARVLVCLDVDYHTVSYGRERAQIAAGAGLDQEIAGAKIDMLGMGLSRLRTVKRQVNCAAAPIATAREHYCVAGARVCANRRLR